MSDLNNNSAERLIDEKFIEALKTKNACCGKEKFFLDETDDEQKANDKWVLELIKKHS